jgi:putative transposase
MEGRKLRKNYNTPGDAHEFTWSCFRGQPFLKSERTCEWLANAISNARKKYEFDVWAYVFMPNHVHLLIHPRYEKYNVSPIKQAIKQSVSQRAVAHLRKFNAEDLDRLRVTHNDRTLTYRFWQDGGGYDRNLFSPEALRKAIDYLHANPVRIGLAITSLEWKWSSACAYQGLDHGPLSVDICEMLL